MYSMADWCKSNGVPLSEEQIVAASYLQSRGARFLIDFGYQNAVDKANDLFNSECERAIQEGLIH